MVEPMRPVADNPLIIDGIVDTVPCVRVLLAISLVCCHACFISTFGRALRTYCLIAFDTPFFELILLRRGLLRERERFRRW